VPDNLELSNDDEFDQGYQSEEIQRSPGRKQSFEQELIKVPSKKEKLIVDSQIIKLQR